MMRVIRASGILGAIGAFTVLIFGGWSSAVIGWLLGTGAGLAACQGQRIPNPNTGARLGGSAGLVLGVWILLASIAQGVVIQSASGQRSLPLDQTLAFGVAGLGLSTIAATLMGAIQGLTPERRRQATLVTLAFTLLSFPIVDRLAQTGWIGTVIQIQIFVILALGLNIAVGFSGLLNLGYAAFFAIGAYTAAFVSAPGLNLGWSFWIAIWAAAGVAALAGVLLGAPTLRLRGDYLAIVTLGFGEIVPVVFRNLIQVQIYEPISKLLATLFNRPDLAICLVGCVKPLNLTRGAEGLGPVGTPTLPFILFQSSNPFPWYYLVLLLVVFSFFLITRLRDSRLGRAWTAIREDELAAGAMGINLVQTKLLAFAMGASFSGLAGAFFAAYTSTIFPDYFDFSVSITVLCMVILGGLGNMTGVVLGGIIITAADRLYLPQLAKVLKGVLNVSVLPNISNPQLKDFLATSLDPIQMRLFLFGLTLVLVMIVRPGGLVPSKTQLAELRSASTEPVSP